MKSIKTKLVLLLSLFILTSSISIGITSIRASTRTAVKEAEKNPFIHCKRVCKTDKKQNRLTENDSGNAGNK